MSKTLAWIAAPYRGTGQAFRRNDGDGGRAPGEGCCRSTGLDCSFRRNDGGAHAAMTVGPGALGACYCRQTALDCGFRRNDGDGDRTLWDVA